MTSADIITSQLSCGLDHNTLSSLSAINSLKPNLATNKLIVEPCIWAVPLLWFVVSVESLQEQEDPLSVLETFVAEVWEK